MVSGSPAGEELSLLVWCQAASVRHASLECVQVRIHQRCEGQTSQVRQVVGAERWTEALMTQLSELLPRWSAGVALVDEVPLLGCPSEVIGGQPNSVSVARLLHVENCSHLFNQPSGSSLPS